MANRPKSTRLGRGLSSLISPTDPTAAGAPTDASAAEVPVDHIDPMDGQPRRHFDLDSLRELAQSIGESGVIQPLVVRRKGDDRYALIAGERRLRASKMAGLHRVPVVIRDVSEREAFALALVENIQREDLNPIEEALAYRRLIDDFGFTQEQIAQQVGKSRSAIANATRLLRLHPDVQGLVADGTLSAGHARAVLSVDEAQQPALAERILTEALNVRQAEKLAKAFQRAAANGEAEPPPTALRPSPPPLSPQLKAVQRRLMERLGTRVLIQRKSDGQGVVELHFANDDGLQALLDSILDGR